MNNISNIEVQFQKYIAIDQNPYYLFKAQELFSEPLLISGKDYPKTLGDLVPEDRLSISIKGIEKLDNKWLLKEIEWQN
jgi:hypothetical protein